jgi:hypothetical protein
MQKIGETEGKVECHWSYPEWGLHMWFQVTFILVQRLEVAAAIMWEATGIRVQSDHTYNPIFPLIAQWFLQGLTDPLNYL